MSEVLFCLAFVLGVIVGSITALDLANRSVENGMRETPNGLYECKITGQLQ